MLDNGFHFKHVELTENVNHEYIELYNAIIKNGATPFCRASLYTNMNERKQSFGFKTALWINLSHSNINIPSFEQYKGLWFIEKQNASIQLLGSKQYHTSKTIGGVLLPYLDIFNLESSWLKNIARELTYNLIRSVDNDFRYRAIQNKRIFGFKSTKNIRIREDENLFHCLYRIEYKLLSNSIEAFIKELKKPQVELVAKQGGSTVELYNHYAACDNLRARNRLQAASSFPAFIQQFKNNYPLRTAIDNGHPLLESIAKFYKVKISTIKKIRKFYFRHDVSLLTYDVIQAIEEFPPNYLPKTNEDFKVFCDLATPIINLSKLIKVDVLNLAKSFIHGWQPGLENIQSKLELSFSITRILNMFHDCYEYGIRPILATYYPCYSNSSPPENWYKDWFSNYGLKSLLIQAEAWENKKNSCLLVRHKKYISLLKWLSLPVDSKSLGEKDTLTIVELTSQDELETEGGILEHCVGDYVSNCINKGSYIFSVRDGYNYPLSTFEIEFKDHKPVLLQLKAKNNKRPATHILKKVHHFIESSLSSITKEQIDENQYSKAKLIYDINKYKNNSEDYTKQDLDKLKELVAFTHPKGFDDKRIVNYFDQTFNFDSSFMADFSICDLKTEFWKNDDIRQIYLNHKTYWCGYLDKDNYKGIVFLNVLHREEDEQYITLNLANKRLLHRFNKNDVYPHLRLLYIDEFIDAYEAFNKHRP